MQDHGQQNDEHSEGNCHNKNRIQFSDKRHSGHMVDRSKPQSRQDIFESKYASEEEAEDRGEDSCNGNDSGKRDLLKMV